MKVTINLRSGLPKEKSTNERVVVEALNKYFFGTKHHQVGEQSNRKRMELTLLLRVCKGEGTPYRRA